MAKSVKMEINTKGLDQLKKDVAASVQRDGVEISCIYCGKQFTVFTSTAECPHCGKKFEIDFKL